MTPADSEVVVAHYAWCMGSVSLAEAPPRVRRGPRRYPQPAALLARLGVDVAHEGRGLGAGLLQDVIARTHAPGEEIGCRGLLVHAETVEARDFYLPWCRSSRRRPLTSLVAGLGWQIGPLTAAPWALAKAPVTLRDLGRDVGPEAFEPYAGAGGRIAAREVGTTTGKPTRAEAVEQLVVGTVVLGAALLARRHLAQEHESTRAHAHVKRRPDAARGGARGRAPR